MSSQCRSCGASIEWARSATSGRPVPLDPDPAERGNVVVERDSAGELWATTVAGDQAGPGLRVSHFATCPQAHQHRRRARAGGGDRA